MKIDDRLRAAYRQQRQLADRLKVEVDAEIASRKPRTWHYESRPKEEESFALKVEAGRAKQPQAIEDAFACALIVPNFSDVRKAEELIVELYGPLEYKRPESYTRTTKSPSDFRFDDLRLYVTYKDQGYGPPTGLQGVLFEVQVRTFLQHAWNIATHDIVYKADNVSWRRERVAHQAKAALEQAEVTIESMAALELTAALPETNDRFVLVNEIIRALKEHWPSDHLPRDLRRLADAIYDLLWNLRLNDIRTFRRLLAKGRERYGGNHNLNWSPYRAISQYLCEQYAEKFKNYLSNDKLRVKTFVYDPVLEQLGLEVANAPRAILLGGDPEVTTE
jgi:ppGpp synthetase/RelA/SpoT-type nucleotidyltranferase